MSIFSATVPGPSGAAAALELLPAARIDEHSDAPGEREVFTRLLAGYRTPARGRSAATVPRP